MTAPVTKWPPVRILPCSKVHVFVYLCVLVLLCVFVFVCLCACVRMCSPALCPLDTPHKERAYAWRYCMNHFVTNAGWPLSVARSLSVGLSLWVSVSPSLRLSVSLSLCLFVSACLPVFLSLSVSLSLCPAVPPSLPQYIVHRCLPTCLHPSFPSSSLPSSLRW
jgi:hypothetical protein